MLTSKERAELRSKANTLDTTLMVGKGGVTDAVIAEAECQLAANELIKGKVLESAMLDPREVSDAICAATGADGVQVVGTKFVLYKHSDQKNKESGARSGKKKNPVKAGIRARRQAMKKQREARNEYFRNAAVQAAIEKRKARMEEND
ncbi:MAG: YhbY family RNA-binding protein [Oscillospiraceae bacterium]|nr:YhbY family RNA-binding protein [Oscillospiraceae bacterium]